LLINRKGYSQSIQEIWPHRQKDIQVKTRVPLEELATSTNISKPTISKFYEVISIALKPNGVLKYLKPSATKSIWILTNMLMQSWSQQTDYL